MLTINSILHFIIDGICAYAMFGEFASKGAEGYLFYNLFAFALQMPIGALADMVVLRIGRGGNIAVKRFHFTLTVLGVLFTIIGIFAGPLSLGVGNAFFHVGGGISSIREDEERGYGGRGLGIFVAPGALGLFIGGILTAFSTLRIYIVSIWIILAVVCSLLLALRVFYEERHLSFVEEKAEDKKMSKGFPVALVLISALICVIVVVLRSYTSMSVSFEWKNGIIMGLLATLAVVMGKVCGGFLSYYIGELKASVISLGLSAVLFLFSDKAVFGLLALFFFNMTMPITLYILVKTMKKCPGFAFGLLTFALFAGFIIVYFGYGNLFSGKIAGCLGSVISLGLLVILLVYRRLKEKN